MINRQKLIDISGINIYTATHHELILYLESQPPADQWIPCSERLPENINTVLITTVYGDVKLGWYNGHCGTWFGYTTGLIQKATAWMPLPEPYKGAE